MALIPSLRPLNIAGRYDSPHTIDIFMDYVCPFSAKMALVIDSVLVPLVSAGAKYDGKVKIIIRPHVQPWHASSTLTHEAGLAVLRASPENYWKFSLALFKHQGDYFDVPSQNLTPLQIRDKLAQLAAQVIPSKAVEEFKELLRHKTTPNGGNAVTDDLKYTIKYSRQNGIHVSPTVLWDGLIASEISSSWGEKEWKEFLASNVTA
ncbi:hypothetical protein AX17_002141 [Amanita inopinata Kibby_2008]|nr:hypothetical protein AX17_002141 [Amanita inopinata Kibby_2008]